MYFQCLIENSQYKIDYCIIYNVDIYDEEIANSFHIIFGADNRKCLIKRKNGILQPNPYFKELNKKFSSFNLCYLMYSNVIESDLFDSDFDIGFNNSDLIFENIIYDKTAQLGYYIYFIYNDKITMEKAEDFNTDRFKGFIISQKILSNNYLNSIDLICNDLNGIDKILLSDAIIIFKSPYYANYNYLLYFNNHFNVSVYIREIFELKD
jgi:hypothetical protein